MFRDRSDAGRRLAAALGAYASRETVVYGLARGGVPVAAEVAEALGAPVHALLVRKIGAPGQQELALGAVADGAQPTTVWNEDLVLAFGLDESQRRALVDEQMRIIEQRRRRFGLPMAPVSLQGATVIVVDDGLATGATAKAALRSMKARGAKERILAVPVAPAEAVADLRPEADRIVCLETPPFFQGVGEWYADFQQVSDEEVAAILARRGSPGAR